MSRTEKIPSSFRDPSGFLFTQDGIIYRQINKKYKKHYDYFVESGLFEALIKANLIIPHDEVGDDYAQTDLAYKVIKPEQLLFVSYCYEWCFSQLKHAALVTLEIQKLALQFGMSLKDCSAYNIQFIAGKPVLIDTLSFEMYKEGKPWVAYKQFCQHFLAPLALMSKKDVRLNLLLQVYLDGIPLDLASALLPIRTRCSFSLLSHIHLHAKSQSHFADKKIKSEKYKMSRFAFLSLVNSLESCVKKLNWQAQGTEWIDYYDKTNYSEDGFQHKKRLISEWLDMLHPTEVWDLGANEGLFSRISSSKGIPTVSFDIDPAAVERNYLECRRGNETNLLPLVLDLTNPSPDIGWSNAERVSLIHRGPADTIVALALIHHLAISNNLPLKLIADFFNMVCGKNLIIEFVPKSDSQVQRLLATREDIFIDYSKQMFEKEFGKYFDIQSSVKVSNSDRTMYLMSSRINEDE